MGVRQTLTSLVAKICRFVISDVIKTGLSAVRRDVTRGTEYTEGQSQPLLLATNATITGLCTYCSMYQLVLLLIYS